MTNEQFQELVLQQLQTLTEGQQRMENRMDNIEQNQHKFENRMENLEQNQQKFENSMENLEQNQQKFENRMENLEQKTNRIDTGLLKLETRMERELIDKIRGLFDAREVQNDRFDSLEVKLDEINESIEYALFKLMKQEIKMQSKRKLP